MPCHCGKRSPCKVQVYKPVVLKLDDTLEPLEVDLPCQLVSVEQTQVSQSSRFPGTTMLANTKSRLPRTVDDWKWPEPRSSGESRKELTSLCDLHLKTSFSLAEGISQQPPSNQPKVGSSAVEQRTL